MISSRIANSLLFSFGQGNHCPNPLTSGDLHALFARTRSQYAVGIGPDANMQNLVALCNGNASHVTFFTPPTYMTIPEMIEAELCNTQEDSASRDFCTFYSNKQGHFAVASADVVLLVDGSERLEDIEGTVEAALR